MTTNRTLTPSEKLKTKYHLWIWLVFLLLVFPFVLLGLIPELGWTYVWIFLLANALWMIPTLALVPAYYRSIEYELGEEEIIVRKGLITKVIKTIPYRTVTNIVVKRGLLDRRLGIGGVAIHTAGFSQQGGPEAMLSGLEDFEGVHRDVFDALRRYRARTGPALGVEEVSEPRGELAELLREILAELRGVRDALVERKPGE